MDTREPTIRLDQFMKLTNMVRSGGEAKHVIQDGRVQVNGVVDTHRSKKLHEGDVVTFEGRSERVSQSQTTSLA